MYPVIVTFNRRDRIHFICSWEEDFPAALGPEDDTVDVDAELPPRPEVPGCIPLPPQDFVGERCLKLEKRSPVYQILKDAIAKAGPQDTPVTLKRKKDKKKDANKKKTTGDDTQTTTADEEGSVPGETPTDNALAGNAATTKKRDCFFHTWSYAISGDYYLPWIFLRSLMVISVKLPDIENNNDQLLCGGATHKPRDLNEMVLD